MKHFSRKSTLQTKPVLDGGGRKEVEEGEGVWDVRGSHSIKSAMPIRCGHQQKREKKKRI